MPLSADVPHEQAAEARTPRSLAIFLGDFPDYALNMQMVWPALTQRPQPSFTKLPQS
jgi:hypothetical protein